MTRSICRNGKLMEKRLMAAYRIFLSPSIHKEARKYLSELRGIDLEEEGVDAAPCTEEETLLISLKFQVDRIEIDETIGK